MNQDVFYTTNTYRLMHGEHAVNGEPTLQRTEDKGLYCDGLERARKCCIWRIKDDPSIEFIILMPSNASENIKVSRGDMFIE